MTSCARCGAGPDKDLQRSGRGKPRAWECVEEEPCALRAELRDATAEIARLRGLPVVSTCGDCGHVRIHPEGSPECAWWSELPLALMRVSTPPAWCPLRSAAR